MLDAAVRMHCADPPPDWCYVVAEQELGNLEQRFESTREEILVQMLEVHVLGYNSFPSAAEVAAIFLEQAKND